jgi:hypothetical protein
MKAIDTIRYSLKFTEDAVNRYAGDMRDAPMTCPMPGGNPVLWNLGHIAVIEAGLPHILLGTEPHPLEHWWPMFGTGSKPCSDAGKYPPFDEVLKQFAAARARNMKLLDEIGESGLDRKPAAVPPGFENIMTSCGQTMLLIALHAMGHVGEIIDARRAAGRKPFM